MIRSSRSVTSLAFSLVLLTAWLIPATADDDGAGGEPASAPAASQGAAKPASAPAAPADRAGSPAPAAKPDRRGKGIRTLDEITIEGEIAVPQVLFITARDRQRYRDFLHRHYLQTAQELGRESVFPEAIGLGPRP